MDRFLASQLRILHTELAEFFGTTDEETRAAVFSKAWPGLNTHLDATHTDIDQLAAPSHESSEHLQLRE